MSQGGEGAPERARDEGARLAFRDERCVLVYALAPEGVRAADANRAVNALVADRSLPLVLWHDHFLDRPGGVILFHVVEDRVRERLGEALADGPLSGWHVRAHPLIYSRSPAGFDGQTAYTLRTYRERDWEELRSSEADED